MRVIRRQRIVVFQLIRIRVFKQKQLVLGGSVVSFEPMIQRINEHVVARALHLLHGLHDAFNPFRVVFHGPQKIFQSDGLVLLLVA